jgi:hypothetical protein
MSPPRGPRSVLCVVVVTKSACGTGVGMHAGRDQTGDMRDVGKEVRADAPGDLTHAREVDHAGVRARPDGDHLRLLARGDGGEFVVVEQAVVLAHAILRKTVELAGKIRRIAVGEVAAVAEVHAQDLVAGLQHRGVDREIGLGAGVRLHIGVIGAEELLRALDREVLDFVDLLATAVPALAGITLRVLVRQHAALGLEHRGIGEILRRDQLDVALLAGELAGDRGVDFRIEGAEGSGSEGHYELRLEIDDFRRASVRAKIGNHES